MEKIISSIAGIMKSSGLRSTSYLGVGKVRNPENSMLITDKRVIFFEVPLPGSGKVIEGTDISMWQWILARKDIEKKLNEMISSMSIQQIINSNPKNYFINLSDIQKVKISKIFGNIKIKTKDNKTYNYTIRNKQDREKLKQLFKNYL